MDKRFEGDLAAIGKGEMLTALTPVKGSAGYVAIVKLNIVDGQHRHEFEYSLPQ